MTTLAAVGYAGYETWRNRREEERSQAEAGELHRDGTEEGDDPRTAVPGGEQVEARWLLVSQAWDALLADTNRSDPAEKLLAAVRGFLSTLADEVVGDSRGQVATASYLYLARIAAAEALAALEEPELAADEVRCTVP